MIKISFEQVTTAQQIDTVTQLANTIWPEHYTPIIGAEQVEYMLKTFHSTDTISDEIKKKGYEYFLIIKDTTPIGYIGSNIEDQELFLSKFYILLPYRNNGFGRISIGFLKQLSRSFELNKITLTVNKNNLDTISAYKKMNFQITAEVCADIGNGYVMDDYKMELTI
ncbi:GNAT family N-acetyltransferase [Sulfurimonas sp. C5]|uniref:GNAT family N-acetyltransferase n=1 Tax=Sulfurimonas sp. C5 TaxID=3036947 RepID=UPI002454799A|nr:GNAT family N-acetyltransferase [Sulfurimonas sp. C5]MDH4943664.1 GNAT family N-acetyltransferase [Sulfurimonas sp. C5]